jgi:outer membrane protein assembly factor BamB
MSKIFAGAGCALLFAALLMASNEPTRVWSQPAPPSREALDRLNLQQDWAVYVPMDGRLDGFASIQVVGNELIVQTRSGMVSILESDNGGRAKWRARTGRLYQSDLLPAFNAKSIFTSDNGNLYALDRETGALQWQHNLSVILSAPPAVDDANAYLNTVQARVVTLRLPAVSATETAPPAPATPPAGEEKMEEKTEKKEENGEKKEENADKKEDNKEKKEETPAKKDEVATQGQPGYTRAKVYAEDVRAFFLWDYSTNERVENKTLIGKNIVFMSIPNGTYLGLPKKSYDPSGGNQESYHYAGDSPFTAIPSQSEDAAYLATQDAHLYAVGIDSGKVLWRYASGRAVRRSPVPIDVAGGPTADRDLYVSAEGKGLARLNRDTGEPDWNVRQSDFNPDADRLLAVNPKFVYAADGGGRMLVLDRKNGRQLSRYDIRDFVFPVVNGASDRIYLAANNGLIVCLHDKDYAQPLLYHKEAPKVLAEKPLKERIQEVTDKLAMPISEPEAPNPITFKAYRTRVALQYGLKIFPPSDRIFKESKLPPPDEMMVTPPQVDKKPLGEAFKEVLKQVNANYTQVEDTIIIGPAAPKGP